MEASAVHAPALQQRAGLRVGSRTALRLRSDDQLLALFRRGSDEAFTVLVDRYRGRLLSYTRRMLSGSPHDAEDALQDVFVRAYGALRVDERPVSVRAWLYRVAHNRCVDQIRRTGPAPEDIYAMSRPAGSVDPADTAERREDLRNVVRDVAALPDTQRSALLLRELDGLSYNELAATLDLSLPAVKSLLVRARTSLAESGEARATPCATIRADLEVTVDTGARLDSRTRRHVRECAPCADYQRALRTSTGTHQAGPLAFLAKLLGVGGASAGGGTAVVGGAVSTKVAAIVCCGALAVSAGAAYELPSPSAPAPSHRDAPRRAVKTAAGPQTAALAAAVVGAEAAAAGAVSSRSAAPSTGGRNVSRTVSSPALPGPGTQAAADTTASGALDVQTGGDTGTTADPDTGLSPGSDGAAPPLDASPETTSGTSTVTGAGTSTAAGTATGTATGTGTTAAQATGTAPASSASTAPSGASTAAGTGSATATPSAAGAITPSASAPAPASDSTTKPVPQS